MLYFIPVELGTHNIIYCHAFFVCSVQCEFFMQDEEGMSIPAEQILMVIRTQTVVFLNSTEYRVLQVERANNDTLIVDPIASASKETAVCYLPT